MTITVFVLSVFVFLSFLSTVVILSAMVSSNQNAGWEERTERLMPRDGELEPVMMSELQRETISVT
jgi:hypothetical protein